MQNILFIGLGVMGYHMAGHLSKLQNINLKVWNRSSNKSTKWQQQFDSEVAQDLFLVANESDIIITCTGRDEDMQEIVLGSTKFKGIIDSLKPKSIFIDHTTTSYKLATDLFKALDEKQISFLDAPVSGGELGAQKGTLSTMVGGNEALLEQLSPILSSYTKNITHIGQVGYGQLAKMVNQICITGVLAGLSEGLSFAEAEGIDIQKLLDAISKGAAGSWQMSNRMQSMHERSFDFGFAIKWMIKDLSYCLNRAKTNGSKLQHTEEVYNKYLKLASNGYDKKDTSALILNDI